jgi:hypothetical protein
MEKWENGETGRGIRNLSVSPFQLLNISLLKRFTLDLSPLFRRADWFLSDES